jgi:DNA-binding transcriptional MerR regulator
MRSALLKTGELARQTGISVRTLHYYDEIGLLSPSHYTEAGHRLYAARDLARLQQIRSLQQLGWSLDEIRDCLSDPGFSPLRVIGEQIARLKKQITLEQMLCERLEKLAGYLNSAQEISGQEFLQTIEVMTMVENFSARYYTPEQLEKIRERGAQLGAERIRQAEAEWPQLIAQVRAEMEKGTDPASEPVQQMAARWSELVNEFTGGDPGIAQSLGTMYQQEPELRQRTGIDQKMFEYISQAMAARRQS